MYGALAPAAFAAALLSHHGTVTVQPGDTLSALAARWCGSAALYPGLAAASGIPDPDVIVPGERVVLGCHAAPPARLPAVSVARGGGGRHAGGYRPRHGGDGDGLPPGGAYCQPNCWGDGDNDGFDLDHSPWGQAAPAYQGRHGSRRSLRTVTVSSGGGGSPPAGFEACVIARESGGNPQVMNSSSHYGLYQFSSSTWQAYGGNPGDFGHASPAEQRRVFLNAMATPGGKSNWSPYDGC